MSRLTHANKAPECETDREKLVRSMSPRRRRSKKSGKNNNPGANLQAGSEAVFLSFDAPGLGREDIQTGLAETWLNISGSPPYSPERRISETQERLIISTSSSHTMELLPYRFDGDHAEMNNRRADLHRLEMEATDLRQSRARQDPPLKVAVDQFFGNDDYLVRNENDQMVLLQTIDSYLKYCRKNGNGR